MHTLHLITHTHTHTHIHTHGWKCKKWLHIIHCIVKMISLPSKINVFAITWIRFIGFRQNLAWTYYLTLGTSLLKNFSFFSKSKMAAGGQKLYFFNVFAITWTRFFGSKQNLAWTYHLTLGTSLRKNFSFFSKIQDGRRRSRSKIGQILPHKSHFGSSFGSKVIF